MKKLMLLALLAGCAPMSEAQRNAYIATYGPVCERSFARDSEPWKQCIVGFVARERQPNPLAQGLTAAGGVLSPQLYQQAPIQTTRCNTTYLGTTCETTPY